MMELNTAPLSVSAQHNSLSLYQADFSPHFAMPDWHDGLPRCSPQTGGQSGF